MFTLAGSTTSEPASRAGLEPATLRLTELNSLANPSLIRVIPERQDSDSTACLFATYGDEDAADPQSILKGWINLSDQHALGIALRRSGTALECSNQNFELPSAALIETFLFLVSSRHNRLSLQSRVQNNLGLR